MDEDQQAKYLLLVNLASGFFSVGAVWLAQLNWMLLANVGPAEFEAFHVAWWHGIWWAIFPVAGLSFIGSLLQLKYRPKGVSQSAVWTVIGLQLITYILTATWWGPGQAQLSQARMVNGTLDAHYLLLVHTHWLRVAMITAWPLLQLKMAFTVFGVKAEDQPH